MWLTGSSPRSCRVAAARLERQAVLMVAVRVSEAPRGAKPISFEIDDAGTPAVRVVERTTFLMP